MELNSLTITQAVEGLKTKKFTVLELVTACFKKIEETDPKVHSFLALNKQNALHQAKEADEILNPEIFKLKPLFGVPVAIKDNFNTLGLETTASSNILKGYVSPYDATVVHRLKEAGAIILGKTNMDAFAHGSSTETSDFGPTLNPWNTSHLPGGSSGGSAAAVSADETIFAIGSETAGSIRGPAAWCNIFGFKPTYGRVSRYGVIAMASSTDSPGPMTKTVDDAALVYDIIAGFDQYDATSSRNEVEKLKLKKDLKGIKIGLPKEYFLHDAQAGVNDAVMKSAKILEQQGATLVNISLFDPKYAISVYTILQRSEVSSNLARFDGIRFGASRDQFNSENKRRIMMGTYTLSAGYFDQYYKKAQKVRTLIVNDFKKAFDSVDLILGPTLPSTAPKRGVTQGQSMYGELADILVEPSAIAGLTAMNLPSGFINGLPLGAQLIGPQWSESLVLSVSKVFQDNSDFWKQKPKI